MSQSQNSPWLNRFAVVTAMATLVLVGIGGVVTSKEAGMSVPDWPTSYGYNMFFFPISKWTGGIFYEHTHRLVATIVGVLVVGLTRWLGGRPARKPLAIVGVFEIVAGFGLLWLYSNLKGTGYFLSGIGAVVLLGAVVWVRNEPAQLRLRQLGWLAFALVQVQGLLGGLRVVLFKNEIGIFHGALAQVFLVLLCSIALFTSSWWRDMPARVVRMVDRKGLRQLFLFGTVLIFTQLVIGATMRHQHAGLAIRDFPLAYHKLWPPLDADSLRAYNQTRLEVGEHDDITAFQIILQMVHRMVALLIFCAVAFAAWSACRYSGVRHPLAKLSLTWLGLILLQITLGAFTIWSNKAADIATAHVVVGALSLVTGSLLTIVSFQVLMPACAASRAATGSEQAPFAPRNPTASSTK
jgi:cytochrome c oxidase assembly protein subunit 15